MAASDHLSEPQFKYHISPARNRASIQANGLDPSKSNLGKRVYLSDEPNQGMGATPPSGYDSWRVNVAGVPLRPDKIDGTGNWYAQRHIKDVELIHKGEDNSTVFG